MTRWRILLTEDIHVAGRQLLARHADVHVASALDEATLCEEIRDVDGIVLRARGRITDRVMDAAPRLRVIGRHGVGVDNVDLSAATARGIQVLNTPDANVTSVAEHTLALMLGLARHVARADRAVRAGDWRQRDRDLGRELTGGTLGVVGLGAIGFSVARMCHLAFCMDVLYADVQPHPDAATTLGARHVPLDDILSLADIVTLHVPLLPATRHMIGRRELALMKPTALLINTARGGVVDEEALVATLHAGRPAGAALDVFEDEPPHPDRPLLASDRLLLTPHSAAMTEQASRRMAKVVDDMLGVLAGEKPIYPVNLVAREA